MQTRQFISISTNVKPPYIPNQSVIHVTLAILVNTKYNHSFRSTNTRKYQRVHVTVVLSHPADIDIDMYMNVRS